MRIYQFGLLFAVVGTACSPSDPIPRAEEQMHVWYKLQRGFARVLEDEVGGRGYHFEPIVGADEPCGTFWRSDLASAEGQLYEVNESDLRESVFSTPPITTVTTESLQEIALPKPVHELVSKKLAAAAGNKKTRTLKVGYVDAVQRIDDNKVFLDRIRNAAPTLGDIKANPIRVIRGKVLARRIISHNFDSQVGAELTYDGDGLSVRESENGGWQITDEKPQPVLWIVAKVTAEHLTLTTADDSEADSHERLIARIAAINPRVLIQSKDPHKALETLRLLNETLHSPLAARRPLARQALEKLARYSQRSDVDLAGLARLSSPELTSELQDPETAGRLLSFAARRILSSTDPGEMDRLIGELIGRLR